MRSGTEIGPSAMMFVRVPNLPPYDERAESEFESVVASPKNAFCIARNV